MRTFVSLAFFLGCALGGAPGCDDPMAPSVSPLEEEVGGGNSGAALCCRQLFPPGPARGQCVSQAAHGTGPCATDAGVVIVPDAAVAPPDAAVVPDAAPLPDAPTTVP
jgi:hypothetical protein